MSRAGVVVLGSINVDLVMRVPQHPRPGETILGSNFRQLAGGKGANQAVAAARAGQVPVTFLAAVGDDEFGRSAIQRLQSEPQLNARYIATKPNVATGVALITVDERGENCICVAGGANQELTATDLTLLPTKIWEAASLFLVSLESPLESVAQGLRLARQHELITIVNPAPAQRAIVQPELASLIDLLTPNESEAERLTGISVVDEASAVLAGRELLKRGCQNVIITRGALGSIWIGANDQWESMAAHAVTACDTTAAGDAFSGALAAALATELAAARITRQQLLPAMQFASRVAAISVTRPGAQDSLPYRHEVV